MTSGQRPTQTDQKYGSKCPTTLEPSDLADADDVRGKIDAPWPGSHTQRIYDGLSKRQANILAQLRIGMALLNGYLHRIKAVESDLCECGEAIESREHFVFRCTMWSEQRTMLGVWTGEQPLSSPRRQDFHRYRRLGAGHGCSASCDPFHPGYQTFRTRHQHAKADEEVDSE